jgi:hypothetical protein
MKVKFERTYRGPLGRFAAGIVYDLNPHVVGQLPEGTCKAVDESPADKQARIGKAGTKVETQ